jgi:hypothetical protein
MEIDQEAFIGMDVTMQRGEFGDDEELVVFPGHVDSGAAAADFDRVMKLGAKAPGEQSGYWVPSLA